MLALVIADTCCVALLAVLVAGLLRSHADILRALHSLGAGVGDPTAAQQRHAPDSSATPVTMGPALAPGRHSTEVYDVAGVNPEGDAVSVSATAGAGLTLLVFLSSGCTSCAGIWRSLGGEPSTTLPAGLRVVVVTKGPDLESPAAVHSQAPAGVAVVMSSAAWSDYEVPGSPFFVLIDTGEGRRVGEGMANQLSQVVELVRRAADDEVAPGHPYRGRIGGPEREALNDMLLERAGVMPGDPSLYPRRLEDMFAAGDVTGSGGEQG